MYYFSEHVIALEIDFRILLSRRKNGMSAYNNYTNNNIIIIYNDNNNDLMLNYGCDEYWSSRTNVDTAYLRVIIVCM